MNNYTALIIEDDIDNINLLKTYIKNKLSNINVVGQAMNVTNGVSEYLKNKPDILLLDIELGNETIFNFIDTIGKVESEIIFISSHTEFGVKAVNYNVTGFIVKPIEAAQLIKIINKAIFNIERKKINQDQALLKNRNSFPLNIAIPSVNKIELISIEECIYLEADGKYTIFNLINNKKKVASRNLGEYGKIIDPKIFFRVHHRYIVNINKVAKIHKTDGTYCELVNGQNIPIAKRRIDLFNRFLKLK
jgi:two-component system LytT family response regulator